MEKLIGINGLGNTGVSILLRMAEVAERGELPLGVVVAHDVVQSAERVVREIAAGFYGVPRVKFRAEGRCVVFGDCRVEVVTIEAPMDWASWGVWGVVEATGQILDLAGNLTHVESGARQVVVTAPMAGESVKTLIYGFNEGAHEPGDVVVDNGSCTTRAVVHVLEGLLRAGFGVRFAGLMVVHPKTRGARTRLLARLSDGGVTAKELVLRQRATSSAATLKKLFGERIGEISGFAVEAPVADGSVCVVTVGLREAVGREEFVGALRDAASEQLKIVARGEFQVGAVENEAADGVVLVDDIAQLAADVWSVPVVFDNRYAAANAVCRLMGSIGGRG